MEGAVGAEKKGPESLRLSRLLCCHAGSPIGNSDCTGSHLHCSKNNATQTSLGEMCTVRKGSDSWRRGWAPRLPSIFLPDGHGFSWGAGSAYLEQGLAAEVHQEESLGSLPPPAFGLLEERAGQQHRVLQDLARPLLQTERP